MIKKFIIIIIIIIVVLFIFVNYNNYKYYYLLNIPYNNLILSNNKTIKLSNTIIVNNNKFKTINITIIPYKNNYLSIIRFCNWYLDFNINNYFYTNTLPIQNFHLINLMDNNFQIIKQKLLYIDCEDIRLFNKNDNICFSCNYFDENKNIYNIMICELDTELNVHKIIKPIKHFYMIKNKIESVPKYIDDSMYLFKNVYKKIKNYNKWEKNWTLFNYNDNLHIIYKWFPLHICKINIDTLELIEIKEMPNIFAFSRGSTNGYEYENLIWFIIHKVTTYKSYYHMFAIFDKKMNLKGYINNFKFENCIVEFCLGLVIEKDRILISYSTYDTNCKIAIYNKKYIENLIIWL